MKMKKNFHKKSLNSIEKNKIIYFLGGGSQQYKNIVL